MNAQVTIGVPSSDLIHARFATSLIGLILSSKGVEVNYINFMSSRITMNRIEIVKFAQQHKSSHLLFIDSDMTFPSNGLLELLQWDKDIVAATACKREEGLCQPIGIPFDASEAMTSKRLIKMRFVGMPFMLVKTSVFDQLKKPYFAEPVDESGDLIPEDNYFCMKALEAGFDIWCDLGLSMNIGHLGVKEYKIAPVPAKPQLRVVGA
jgi:hypothetical protein